MVTLHNALERVKQQVGCILPAQHIRTICHELGYRFRQRQLGPVETLTLFLIQILHGNTACSHLRHLAGMTASVSAYCQARMRLRVELLRRLLRWVTAAMRRIDDDASRYHGHRVFHMDGSSFSMPDTPDLQKTFGQPGGQRKGCGFPTAHLLALTDADTGLILDVIASPLRTHDISVAPCVHPRLRPGDLLVADRGFCGYAHVALLYQAEVHAIFRIHQARIVDFTPGRRHSRGKNDRAGLPTSRWIRAIAQADQMVQWRRPTICPHWMTRDEFTSLPEWLTIREVRYRVEADGYRTRTITLATTLLDETIYSQEEVAELYVQRWRIETGFRHLKITMGMDVLRCQTAAGVLKELLMFVLVYNLIRCVMLDAARRQGVPPDRISFVDALRWLRTAPCWTSAPPALIVNAIRPGRQHPRAVKRRPKQYSLLTQPRQEHSTYCRGQC